MFKSLAVALGLVLAACSQAGTYNDRCKVPLSHWRKPSEGMNHHAIPNRVRLDGTGQAFWNGLKVDESKLAHYIEQSRPMNPLPFLILSPDDDASCVQVRQVRAMMDERYCNIRWACGEGRGEWQPMMDLPPPEELRRLEAIADEAANASSR